MKKVCCGSCGYGLMISDEEKSILSMRYKDLYFWISGGMIEMICKGCGTQNLIVDSEYETLHADLVAAKKTKPGVVSAVMRDWVSREDYVPQYANKKRRQ